MTINRTPNANCRSDALRPKQVAWMTQVLLVVAAMGGLTFVALSSPAASAAKLSTEAGTTTYERWPPPDASPSTRQALVYCVLGFQE